MRPIKDLLKITLKAIEKNQFPDIECICDYYLDLYWNDEITEKELIALREYMDENEPDKAWLSVFWWVPGKMKPRIKWLKEQIKKLEK